MEDSSFAQLLASADSVEISATSPTTPSASKTILQRSAATLAVALISSTLATMAPQAVAAPLSASPGHNLINLVVDGQEMSYLSVGDGIEMVQQAARAKGLATGWEGLHFAINEATGFAPQAIAKCMPRAKTIEEAVSSFAEEFKSAEDWARDKGSQTAAEYASAITAYNHASMSACNKWRPQDIIQFSEQSALKVQLKSTTLLASSIRNRVHQPEKTSGADVIATYQGFRKSTTVDPDYRSAATVLGADATVMYSGQVNGIAVYLFDSEKLDASTWIRPEQAPKILLTTGFLNTLSTYIGGEKSTRLALDSILAHEFGHINNHQSLSHLIEQTSDQEFSALRLSSENVADATAAVALFDMGYDVNDLKLLHIAMDMLDAQMYSVATASRSVIASYTRNDQQILHELSLATSTQDAKQRMVALALENQNAFEQLATLIKGDLMVSATPVYLAEAPK